jgi:hypothetical protein
MNHIFREEGNLKCSKNARPDLMFVGIPTMIQLFTAGGGCVSAHIHWTYVPCAPRPAEVDETFDSHSETPKRRYTDGVN